MDDCLTDKPHIVWYCFINIKYLLERMAKLAVCLKETPRRCIRKEDSTRCKAEKGRRWSEVTRARLPILSGWVELRAGYQGGLPGTPLHAWNVCGVWIACYRKKRDLRPGEHLLKEENLKLLMQEEQNNNFFFQVRKKTRIKDTSSCRMYTAGPYFSFLFFNTL